MISSRKEVPFSQKQWLSALKIYMSKDTKNKSYFQMVDSLNYKPISKTSMQKSKNFIAFDTETFEKNGNLICLCNSENDNTLYGSVDKQPDINQYFNYFLNLKRGKGTIFGAWNLKFDATIILKCLPEETAHEFYYGDEDGKYNYTFPDGMKLSYLPKKALTIRKNNHSIVLYDFLQFFGGSLEKASQDFKKELKEKNVLAGKEYDGLYQDKKFPDVISPNELSLIVKYCQKDCVLTKKLMEIWVEGFQNNFGFVPDKYYSAGYLSKTYVSTEFEKFNTFTDIPYPVNALAYNTYFGGRFENMIKGSIKNVYHWDINSAYPYAMTQIPDFQHGKWSKVDYESYNLNTKAGYYKIKVNVKEKDVAPFAFRDTNGRVAFPKGEFTTYCTHHELKTAFASGYDFDLLNLVGYEFLPDYFEPSPFNKLVQGMYDARLKMAKISKSQSTVYKVLVNSLYGKFAQAKPSPKGFFNPVVASYITGFCRAMLLDAVKDHKESIVMFATDGVFATKDLDLDVTTEKILGAWDFEKHPDFSIIMPGIYSYNTPKDKELSTQSRGFSLKVYPKEKSDKPMTFNLNEYQLTKDNGKYYYEFFNDRPIALSEAIIQKKYDIEVVGKFRKVRKEIDLNGERKRLWFGELHDINDLVYSETRDVELFK